MEEKGYKGYSLDYLDRLLPKQLFVYGNIIYGYHTSGTLGTTQNRFVADRGITNAFSVISNKFSQTLRNVFVWMCQFIFVYLQSDTESMMMRLRNFLNGCLM